MLLVSFILLFVITSQQLISSGQLAMPSQSSIFQDPRITIKLFVDKTNITIWAKLHSFGYFGILYGPVMDQGDYSIIQFDNNTLTINIKDYHSPGGHLRPVEDKINNLKLLGYQTNKLDYVIAKFTRYLSTNDLNDTELQVGQDFLFSWAKRKNYLVLKSHKEDDLGIFGGILTNNQTFDSYYDSQYKIDRNKSFKHGIILTFVWYVLADLAILVKYFYKLKYRIQIHIGICCFIIFITIYQIYNMFSNEDHHRLIVSEKIQSHQFFATLILFWIFLQGFFGLVNRIFQTKNGLPSNIVLLCRKVHKLSGLVLIIIAKLNVFIGWTIFNSKLAQILLCIWFCFSAYIYVKYIKKNIFSNFFNEVGIKQIGSYIKLVNQTNNQYFLQGNYVIFDSKVYQLDSNFIHPGGVQIIKSVKGRQIDRFIYGIQRIQNDEKSTRFVHPANSTQLLGKPVYIFPSNQIYFLQCRYFNVHSQIRLTSSLRLFYFKSVGDRTIFQQNQQTLMQIGQYFKIVKFGITRLYSNVSCLRRENISKINQIFKKFNMDSYNYQNVQINKNYIELKQNLYQKDTLIPILMKKYDDGQFTSQFYQNIKMNHTCIQGLKGRGLGIQYMNKGQILIIAGGTGLFPFLDLIDILFKMMVGQYNGQKQTKIMKYYKEKLSDYNFIFFISVKSMQQLILVNQLSYLANLQNKRFKLFLRIKQKGLQEKFFKNNLINQKFSLKFIQKFIQVQKLSKVMICGPARLYKEVTNVIKQSRIQLNKVYYV